MDKPGVSQIRKVGQACLAIALLCVALTLQPSPIGATPATDGNPDLQQRCGIDVTLIIDRSGSIGGNNDEVRDAARALINALVGTGSRVQVITFSSRASALVRNGPGSYSEESSLSALQFYDAALLTDLPAFTSTGSTNWDDGLEMARRSPAGVAPFTVILTDGDPTRHLEDSPDGHGGSLGGDGSDTSATDISRAEEEADFLRSGDRPSGGDVDPTHLFGVGVGLSDLSNPGANTSEGRIRRITGEEQLSFDGSGNPLLNGSAGAFGAGDYVMVDQFSQLETSFRRFVRELCAPSVSVVKYLQQADGSTVQATAADPHTFGLTISPAASSWQNPALPAGTASAQLTTDEQGRASFKWEPNPPTGTTSLSLTELGGTAGYVFNGARCVRNNLDGTTTPIAGLSDVPPNAIGSQAGSSTWAIPGGVGPEAGINCEVYNRQLRSSVVQVDKVTVPAGLPDLFGFTLSSGGATLQTLPSIAHATPVASFTPVAPGTYTIAEVAAPGFVGAGSCDDQGTPANEALSPVGLAVGEGRTWRCTFTNTAAPGSIRVVKQTVGAAAGTFAFTSNIPGQTSFPIAAVGGTGTTAAFAAPVGTYSVAEVNPAPWSTSGASCSDGSPVSAIAVGPGEAVVCTFTNTAPIPTIAVDKARSVPSVAETGAPVTYSVTITNTSVEPVTIQSITDAVDGGASLAAGGTCADLVGDTLAIGAVVECEFTLAVDGDAGDVVQDVVTVVAEDSDGNDAFDSGTAQVAITDVAPTIVVTKMPDVPSLDEPGGTVNYTVVVENTSAEAVTIREVRDVPGTGPSHDVCASLIGTVLPAGSSSPPCTFSLPAAGNAGDVLTDTVTVEVEDDDGTESSAIAVAEVEITDARPMLAVTKTPSVPSVPESGASVTYTVDIENQSVEPVQITSLVDVVDGGSPSPVCAGLLGSWLAAGAATSCQFTRAVVGNAGSQDVDVVTVQAHDDEANLAQDSGEATVAITDVAPAVTVTKTASTPSVPEPGGAVTYTIEIGNPSFESITISSVVDAFDGGPAVPLTGACGALVGDVLTPGATATCQYTATLTGGDAPATTTNVVTVNASDDDGGPEAVASDDATVAFTDVAPTLSISKSTSAGSVPEPGGLITFTLQVTNTSPEPVVLTSITDAVGGEPPFALPGACAALVGSTLGAAGQPGYQVVCSFTLDVAGNAGDIVTDVATATAEDDEGNEGSASDDAAVVVTGVNPSVSVVKSAAIPEVPEPGAPVEFSVVIANPSAFEAVAIESIQDIVGAEDPVAAGGTCAALVGTSIAPLASVGCSFVLPVLGNAGTVHEDVVVVEVVDDDGVLATDEDDATVTVLDAAPAVQVVKAASTSSVLEPGAPVTFTVTITNPTAEPITITAVVDEVGGDEIDLAELEASDCDAVVGQELAPGGSATCTFTLDVDGDAGDVVSDTVVATAEDDEGNETSGSGEADVDVTDATPSLSVTKTPSAPTVAEPGSSVTFTVAVTNGSAEPVTVTALTDDVAGTEADILDLDPGSDCAGVLGAVLAPGATATCSFTIAVDGDAGDEVTDTVTAVGVDDEQNEASATASASVAVTDVLPSVSVVKDAVTTSVSEPGGPATFLVTIANTSSAEAAHIDSIEDVVPGGTLTAPGTCAALVGTWVPPLASVQCQFTLAVTGNAGDTVADTVTVDVSDDDGNETTGSDAAVVVVDDALPVITVAKAAAPTSVPEPSGQASFTVTITNDSFEPVTLVSISDVVGGVTTDVAELGALTDCDDLIGTTIAAQASTSCTFTGTVSGDAGDEVTDVVTVVAMDDERHQASGSDEASVEVTDVLPAIEVTKAAGVESVAEPGGPVTFSVTIRNTGVEPVTVASLVDLVPGGSVVPGGTCAGLVGTSLAPGAEVGCQFTLAVEGDAGDIVEDTIVVEVSDDEGNVISRQASDAVAVTDVQPSVTVVKEAVITSVAEPGADVTYTLTITNTSPEPVTVVSVVDAVGGADPVPAGGSCAALVGSTLAPGDVVTCSFTLDVAGDAGDVVADVVSVTVADDDDNTTTGGGGEAVDVTDVEPVIAVTKTADVASVAEPGGLVTYTVTVENLSPEPVTVLSVDEQIGERSPEGAGGTCADVVGTTIAAGATASCTFSATVAGDAGDDVVDTVTVTAEDDDDNETSASGSESVVVTDVAPSGTVTKTPSVDSVDEPGGDVTYAVAITNTSVEAVTITAITDTVAGSTVPVCAGGLGVVLDPDESFPCEFTAAVTGNAGDQAVDTVEATLVDNEQNEMTPTASATVAIDDVLPTIAVAKDNGPGIVAAPGDEVPFAVTVTNLSPEPVTTTSLLETLDLGLVLDLSDALAPLTASTCAVGAVLAAAGDAGDSYDCSFGLEVLSDELLVGTEVIDVTAVDDEGNVAVATAIERTAVVPIADLALDKRTATSLGTVGAYALTVTNLGPSTAVDVIVRDDLPDGVVATGAVGDGWTCQIRESGSVVECRRSSLAPDVATLVTVEAQFAASTVGTTVRNEAEVSATTTDPDLTNNRDATEDLVALSGELGVEQQALPRTGTAVRGPLATAALFFIAGYWCLTLDLVRRRRLIPLWRKP